MPCRLFALAGLLSVALACNPAEQPPAPPEEVVPAKPTPTPLPEGMLRFTDPDARFSFVHSNENVAIAKRCDDLACTWTLGLPDPNGAPREDAQISILAPKTKLSTAELKTQYVAGPIGIFGTKPEWNKTGAAGGNPSMPWLTEVTSFDAPNDIVGRVLVGDSAHGAFRIIEHIKTPDLESMRPLITSVYTSFQLDD